MDDGLGGPILKTSEESPNPATRLENRCVEGSPIGEHFKGLIHATQFKHHFNLLIGSAEAQTTALSPNELQHIDQRAETGAIDEGRVRQVDQDGFGIVSQGEFDRLAQLRSLGSVQNTDGLKDFQYGAHRVGLYHVFIPYSSISARSQGDTVMTIESIGTHPLTALNQEPWH